MRESRIIVFLVALVGCGQAAETRPQQCHDGICGPGSAGAGAGSSNSASGSPTGSSSAGCAESWTCTPWAKQSDGSYTRVCTDASGCGNAANKPPEGPVMLPDLDADYYKCKVEPIFDKSCSMLGCHGTETGRAFKVYARGRLRHKETVSQVSTCPIGPQMVDLSDMGSGTVMCVGWSPHTAAEWQSNYDISRSFMLGVTDPDESDLIAQPIVGGKAHAGVHLFESGDADHTTLKAWLGGAKLGTTCNPLPN